MTRKTFCLLIAGIALVVIPFVIYAASKRTLSNFGDWYIVLVPVIIPLLSAFMCFMLYRDFKGKHPFWRASLWGGFVGGNGFLLVMAFNLFSRYQLILADGTAFWGILFVPCFYIGLPSVFVGALIGLVVRLIVNKKH